MNTLEILQGVKDWTTISAVYDVSAHFPTGGVNGGNTYTLSGALAMIPNDIRKGGMSIRFVSSSDNKYVQYRLMSDSFSTTESDWQGVDTEPTAGSRNLVESGGVEKVITGNIIDKNLHEESDGALSFQTSLNGNNKFSVKIIKNAGNLTKYSIRVRGNSQSVLRENCNFGETYSFENIDVATYPNLFIYQGSADTTITATSYELVVTIPDSINERLNKDESDIETLKSDINNLVENDTEIKQTENVLIQDSYNLNNTLTAYGETRKYNIIRNKRFEATGYAESASYCCSPVMEIGTYHLPEIANSYLFSVYYWISDNEGSQIFSYNSVSRDFIAEKQFVVTFKRADSGSLRNEDIEYFENLIYQYSNDNPNNELIFSDNFSEDADGTINYTHLIGTGSFIVKIDKVSGNLNAYSVRLRKANGTDQLVIVENCVFGVEYQFNNLDVNARPQLYIRQSSSGTAITETTYNITVKNIPSIDRLPVIENTIGLRGKSILMLGDSITQLPKTGSYTYGNGIVEYFAEKTGANVIRGAVGGGHLASRIDISDITTITTQMEARAAMDVINLVKALCTRNFSLQDQAVSLIGDSYVASELTAMKSLDMSKLDILTIFAGTNDWTSECVIGEADSNNILEYKGALNMAINMLCSTYPKLKIYLFTPIVRWYEGAGTLDWDNPSQFSDTCVNDANVKLSVFADAVLDVAKRNHIPACDLYNGLGWNVYNYHVFCRVNDGTHPYKGFEQIADKMASFIMSNQ